MLFNFLNLSIYLISKIRMHLFTLFIFLLFLPLILSLSIMSFSSNKDTLPMNIQQIIPAKYIKENTDLYLISTKDGYLHALNNDKKQIWKVFLEQELMSMPLSPRKIGKDFYLYPINERLYIYKDGEFISFNLFIKDLVNKHYITISDFTLTGKTKTTLFIIDVDTGEIIQKIDDENNFSFKKRYILTKNKNTITVARVDYILNCLGLGEEQKFWNATYSDILIQKGNENIPDNIQFNFPSLDEIINEYNINNIDINNDITSDNIITAYSYFDKGLPPIKFYDKSESRKKLDLKNKLSGEMKELTEYNNKNKNKYELIDENQIMENINKNNKEILELPNYIDIDINNKAKESISKFDFILNHIENNWILYIIILFLVLELIYYKYLHNTIALKNKIDAKENETNKSINNINNNKNNDIINNEKKINDISNKEQQLFKNLTFNNKTVLLKHKNQLESKHVKQNSFDITREVNMDIQKNNIINNNNNNELNKEKEIINQENSLNNLENNEKEKKNNIINSGDNNQSIKDEKENTSNNKESDENLDDEEKNKNNNNEKKEEKNEKEEIDKNEKKNNGNWNEDDNNNKDDNNEKNKKSNNSEESIIKKSEKKTNGIWDEEDDDEDDNNNDDNNEDKDNEKSNYTEKSSNLKKSEKSSNLKKSKKKTNGIWDDEDEDEDEKDDNNEDNNEDNDNEKKDSIEKSSNLKKGEKQTNGIWDDNDDENEEKTIKTIKSNIGKSDIIFSDSNTSYEKKETNEDTNPPKSKELNDKKLKKEKKQSRLDTDFENLEKIGQGGFGVVLKGRHKIDKDIYAIKIIDITYNSKECDEIISEAKKMNSIKGEYIVNYAICWYDDNLGSAEKFFEKEKDENSSSLSSSQVLSKSITINLTKKQKNDLLYKDDKDIFNIQEVNEENYDENINNLNNIIFNDKDSNSKSKSKNKNNSLELLENNNNNQIYNNKSKYCFEYMDDSRLLNNSILSKKYNEEIHKKKDKKYFFILMEYCDGLTLEIFINQHSNKTIERKIIYNYIKQILKGLKKLHKNGIIHRDIKPGNIFIKNEQIKIGDFGLATKFQKNSNLLTKDLRGFTPTYAAPEQLNSKTYNEKIDIYACGITLLEMCSCFGTEMERQLSIRDLKTKRNISERVMNDYPQECELIKMMTEKDYNERPSAEQILKSNLFIELGKTFNK